MERLVWISMGGAIGTGARYLLDSWISQLLDTGFPAGTFAVNLVGSFLLGVAMCAAADADWLSTTAFLALTTGAMGGFTTYSTFSYETMEYLADGAYGAAAIYVGATLFWCLVGSFAGVAVSDYFV